MHASSVFKSSAQCRPSPDGELLAALSGSSIIIRSTQTLETVHAVRLPSTVSGPFLSLQWSTTSSRILLATADQINVFSARDASFHARIDNPLAGTAGSGGGGKQYFVAFGSGEAEIIVIAAFGLKILIFDLTISKAVELGNPKYYHPSSAGRCFSNRPASGHLALLTRSSGKDTISIHHPVSRKVQSTWDPDTVDAHSLVWTSDSQWLLLWDNPAYGHKLDLYTLEGHLVRTFNATDLSTQPDVGLALGIKLCLPSPDATLCAVGDGSPTVYVLRTDLWAVKLRLLHRTPIVPVDTMQVWQEQLEDSPTKLSRSSFTKASQSVSPQKQTVDTIQTSSIPRSGCSTAIFDASSTLLATRLDDCSSTIWIWDVQAAELRAVLFFHSNINFSWHPHIRELLLMSCLDGLRVGMSYTWDPLSEGPKPIYPGDYLPSESISEKRCANWVAFKDAESPLLLVSSDHRHCLLSLSETQDLALTWDPTSSRADSSRLVSSFNDDAALTQDVSTLIPDDSFLDDTFSFKNN